MNRRSTQGRRAVAAVELALILPLLMVFLLGAIDYGRYAETDLAVTNAVRVGVAKGTEHPFTPETKSHWESVIREAVLDEMSGLGGFDENQMTLTITTTSTAEDSWVVEVQASYPFRTVIDWPGIPEEVTLGKVLLVQSPNP